MDPADLKDFLEDTSKVLADLREAEERLRSQQPKEDTSGGLSLHSVSDDHDGSEISLASMERTSSRSSDMSPELSLASLSRGSDLLEVYGDAGSSLRSELLRGVSSSLQLYSVVSALYRPAPVLLPGHRIDLDRFPTKVGPGGQFWKNILQDFLASKLAPVARHAVRLDKPGGFQAGSAFLIGGERLLTAAHVVLEDGWLFGNPPDPAANSGVIRYNCVNRSAPGSDLSTSAVGYAHAQADNLDMAVILQSADWRDVVSGSPLAAEFESLGGLSLHDELSEADLKNREVAVIGHPASGNSGGKPADIPDVFGGGSLGDKRFMPGRLHGENPLVMGKEGWLLNHDCSTLGGASGSCLIDILTGKVLGIHVGGDARVGNRAVPAWSVAEILEN